MTKKEIFIYNDFTIYNTSIASPFIDYKSGFQLLHLYYTYKLRRICKLYLAITDYLKVIDEL